MRQFYLAYPNTNAVRSQLTWTNYWSLMRLDNLRARAFYERMAIFYHRIAQPGGVELKIGDFGPADAAQIKLYLNWTRADDWREGEGEPIGLILGGSKNQQVAELLPANPNTSMDERIKVARRLLLDSEGALKERLAQISEGYEQRSCGYRPLAPRGTRPVRSLLCSSARPASHREPQWRPRVRATTDSRAGRAGTRAPSSARPWRRPRRRRGGVLDQGQRRLL